MKPIDIILIIIVAAIVGTAIFVIIKSRRNGKSCGCGCANCPSKKKCR